jgi:hypothetical protein
MAAEPVIRPRQFPGRVEIPRIGGERGGPQVGCAARAGELGAVRVKRVWRLSGENRDIE